MTKKVQLLHPDFVYAQKMVYQSAGLVCSNMAIEEESQEYGACRFTMNDLQIQFRVAKITPTKIGQFVTFWKRSASGPIAPFDMQNLVDLFVVSVRSKSGQFGQFVFPKSVLCQQGFVSKNDVGGKRAMRVYPPWDKPDSKQALTTQKWQLNYFVQIDASNLDVVRIRELFFGKKNEECAR